MKGMINWFVAAIIFVSALLQAEISDDIHLKLRQVYPDLPQIKVYFNIYQSGKSLDSLNPSYLKAKFRDHDLKFQAIIPVRDSEEWATYVFIANISSLTDAAGLEVVKNALNDWVKSLRNGDRAILLSFGDAEDKELKFTSSQSELKAQIDSIATGNTGITLDTIMLRISRISKQSQESLPARKVIIFVTDESLVYSGLSDEAKNIGLPVYAIGFLNPVPSGQVLKVSYTPENEEILQRKLQNLASLTRGEFLLPERADLLKACADMRKKISELFVATLICEDCPDDLPSQALLNDLRISLADSEIPQASNGFLGWLKEMVKIVLNTITVLLLALVITAFVILYLRSRKKKKSAQTTALPASTKPLTKSPPKTSKKFQPGLKLGNAQHKGVRREQQDAFGFSNPDDGVLMKYSGQLAVVADGMGGMSLGKEASNIAVRTFLDIYENKPQEESPQAVLKRAILAANEAVLKLAEKTGLSGRVGTTLVAIIIRGNELHWISAGDSRIYLCREGELTQLTTDHTYIRELIKEVAEQKISEETALNHPDRHSLTSYLGLENLSEIEQNLKPFPLRPGDNVLLCTDGLYECLSDEEMAESFSGDPVEDSDTLVRKALDKSFSNQDNITALVLAYS